MSLLASRRAQLHDLKAAPSHAGLWLDKYMPHIQISGASMGRDESDPRRQIIQDAGNIKTPDLYTHFYRRWQQALVKMGATCKPARAQGRIAIGLGNESVQETAISLHRTYGVPYLPGSALKGLAASFAAKRLGAKWERNSKAYITLFGDTDRAGYVTFFDAYPDPAGGPLLHPDIMAIHHPDYYQGQENAAPADWDNPNLVPFPTATGSYLVALAGPQDWVDTAFQILALALQEMGVGAKTSSGYGRMVFENVGQSKEGGGAGEQTTQKTAQEPYALARKRLLSEPAQPGRQRGTVRKAQGSFGFIASATGGPEIFVHQNDLRAGQGGIRVDQVVEYRLAQGKKGPQATDVLILLQPPA